MMPSAKPLKALASVALTPLVRKALSHNDAVVLNWTYEALHGASFNSEIYRFSGNARNHEDILRWSLILKILRSPDGKDDSDCSNYWKREALAYRSGLLDQLPPD